MTFDTTQIFLKSRKRDYVLIDSPGHSGLVKNMITGASLAQAAILVVDVTEGVKEQTRSHIYLLDLMGINEVVVVLNKMDLIDYNSGRFREIRAEVRETFSSLGIKLNSIVPVSAKEGTNISRNDSLRMSWYQGVTLLEAIDSLKTRKRVKSDHLLFAVQDIYANNQEKIIVGKVLSGTILKGKSIKIAPSFIRAKVKALKGFPEDPAKAEEGQNSGVLLDRDLPVKRGDILFDADCRIQLSTSFKAAVFWLSADPLKINEPLLLRCATQEIKAFARNIENSLCPSNPVINGSNTEKLMANESALVTFDTEAAIVLENSRQVPELARLVIEKDFQTLGLGMIT